MNETYRIGIQLLLADKSGKNIEKTKEEILNKPTFGKHNEHIKECPWCDAMQMINNSQAQCQHIVTSPKGNRRHAFLHCRHDKLQSFRNYMNTIIEQSLNDTYNYTQETTTQSTGEKIFIQANAVLYEIYNSDLGRLTKKWKGHVENTYFLKHQQWLNHFQINDIQTGIHSGKPILSHMLGFHGSGENDNTC